jgi:hypothetical protein
MAVRTLARTPERVAPERVDNPLAFFRALPLAVGLSLLFWGSLAAFAYGLYELAVRL